MSGDARIGNYRAGIARLSDEVFTIGDNATRLRHALTDAAYADASSRLGTGSAPASAEAWVELRAASAVLQTHGGHPMLAVYAFLADVDAFPSHFGTPPPDLRERLLFAYSFLLATSTPPPPPKDTP